MIRQKEEYLIEACLRLIEQKQTTLGHEVGALSALRYIDAEQFQREVEHLFKRLPAPYVHASELPEVGCYKIMKTVLGELVFVRSEDASIKVFKNTCIHRGARLITSEKGCQKRLICPYHGWAYGLNGQLKGVPSHDQCFPNLILADQRLHSVYAVERHGLVWVCPDASSQREADEQLSQHLAEVEDMFSWMALESLFVFKAKKKRWHCNWKILAEGGLETYHFAKAHQKTIAPFFTSNTALHHSLGLHQRIIIPSKAYATERKKKMDARQLRGFTHTLLALMPQSSFLVQEHHVDWIQAYPISEHETELIVTSLIPEDPQHLTDARRRHWQSNFSITLTTLDEDFVIGEGIQASMVANPDMCIRPGLSEAALLAFNQRIDELCGQLKSHPAGRSPVDGKEAVI